MDILGTVGFQTSAGAVQAILTTVLASAACYLHLPSIVDVRMQDISIRDGATAVVKTLITHPLEVAGFVLCVFFALMLRLRGDQEMLVDPVAIQVWTQIKAEWPILMGADTLLCFQAMLRLLAVAFVVLRTASTDACSSLSGMAAVLTLGGAVARGALATRTRMYMLEGPLSLGGDLPAACEAAMIPLLTMLCLGTIRKAPVAISLLVGTVTWFASYHYLNLAADPHADRLFTLAHALETCAAIAFLVRTIIFCIKPKATAYSASVGFIYLLMPFQQALAAYYYLTALEPNPNAVGAGHPYCMLAIGNLLQLTAYLTSAAFVIAVSFDDSVGQGSLHVNDRAGESNQANELAQVL